MRYQFTCQSLRDQACRLTRRSKDRGTVASAEPRMGLSEVTVASQAALFGSRLVEVGFLVVWPEEMN